jgi:hypothetical protein
MYFKNISFWIFNLILSVWVFCLCVFLRTACVSGSQKGQKRTWGPLEQGLWLAVSCHVDAGNQILVLCKSSQCGPSSWASSPAPSRMHPIFHFYIVVFITHTHTHTHTHTPFYLYTPTQYPSLLPSPFLPPPWPLVFHMFKQIWHSWFQFCIVIFQIARANPPMPGFWVKIPPRTGTIRENLLAGIVACEVGVGRTWYTVWDGGFPTC